MSLKNIFASMQRGEREEMVIKKNFFLTFFLTFFSRCANFNVCDSLSWENKGMKVRKL